MSFYRQMERSRHGDERIQTVGPIARAVFDYLCCNDQDDLCGLYRLSVAKACEDTGWSQKQFLEALNELGAAKNEWGYGLAEWDPKGKVVWVPGMFRRCAMSVAGKALPKQVEHTVRQLRVLPKSELVSRMAQYVAARYSIVFEGIDHLSLSANDSKGISDSEIPRHSVSVSVSVSDSVSEGGAGGSQPPPIVDEVLACMRDAIRELNPRSRGPGDTPENRKLVMGPVKSCGANVDDWRNVIRRQLESVRQKPEAHKFLALATLGIPRNFQRLLDMPDGAWANDSPQRGNTLVDVVRHEQTEMISEF